MAVRRKKRVYAAVFPEETRQRFPMFEAHRLKNHTLFEIKRDSIAHLKL
jgi:hypothetical protein